MVNVFLYMSLIISIIMILMAILINKKEHKLRRTIQNLFVIATLCLILNAITLMKVSPVVARVSHGLYLATTDWMVVTLFVYTVGYTRLLTKNRPLKLIMYLMVILDNISLLVNNFTHHMFKDGVTEINGVSFYKDIVKFPMYATHFVAVYSIVLLTLFLYLYRILKGIRIYRGRYKAIALALLLVMAANVIYRFTAFNIDISPILYVLMAITICYFTLYFVPKGVVTSLLACATQYMDSGILCFDIDGACIYANDEMIRIFGENSEPADFEDYYQRWKKDKTQTELYESKWSEEIFIDGVKNYYNVSFRSFMDEKNNNIGGFFTFENNTGDIEEMKRQRYRAIHDKLTGLYNREGFVEKVSEKLQEKPDQEYTVVCTDIKEFKLVNELFGYKKGDEILKKIASYLVNDTSDTTVYGRIGVDIFALFMYTENYNEQMFVDYVHELGELASNSVYRMHLHVGVYKDVNKEQSVASMCDRALLAIDCIKDDYQRVVAYYEESMADSIKNENMIISEFDRAMENEEFVMYLQPQFDHDDSMQGAEALVRWKHPEKGMVPPVQFIPVFEKVSYIHRLDMCIWEQACRKLKEWKYKGLKDLYISVNISPKDFYLIDIYKTLTGLVERYDIEPRSLKLEITETTLMSMIKQQAGLLERLREYGFIVEIDDFGSGYSSLNTLKDIRADVLKLDMGFMGDTKYAERSQDVVDAIVMLCKKLGLVVVSEGVETTEQVEFLKSIGCDMFQGYYFAKPISVDEFEKTYLSEI